jgi:hypothetical protein
MVMMLLGENSRTVVQRSKERLAEIQAVMPPDVKLEILYDRADLIQRTLHTVVHNLVEGGILVILVLLILLGSWRAGLVVALAIPLSMLFATNIMLATGVTASLMSLGAIDFGLIVDSSVIMIENCMRRIAHNDAGRSHWDVIRDAAIEVRKPTMFGELIIAVVYLPILTLQGTEGKLFKPMAMTVLFALAGSARADDTPKLLGKWEITKSETEAPVGTVVEFMKDGKMKAVVTNDGKELRRIPNTDSVLALSGDGKFHSLYLSNGEEPNPAVPFPGGSAGCLPGNTPCGSDGLPPGDAGTRGPSR